MNDVLCIDLGASYAKVAYLRVPRSDAPPTWRGGGHHGHTWSAQSQCLHFDSEKVTGFCLPTWARERLGSPGEWIFADTQEAGAHSTSRARQGMHHDEPPWKIQLYQRPEDTRIRRLCAQFFAHILKASHRQWGCLKGVDPYDLVITVPSMSGDQAYRKALGAAVDQACTLLSVGAQRPASTRFEYEPLCNVLGLCSRGQNVWNGHVGRPHAERTVSLRGTFDASPIDKAVQQYMHASNMHERGPLRHAPSHKLRIYVLDLGSFTADMACISVDVGSELGFRVTKHSSVPIGLAEAVDKRVLQLVRNLPGVGPAASKAFEDFAEVEDFKKAVYSGSPYYVGGSRPLPGHVDEQIRLYIREYTNEVMAAFSEFRRQHGVDAAAIYATGGPLGAAYVQAEVSRLAAREALPLELVSTLEHWGLPNRMQDDDSAQATLAKAQRGLVATSEQLSRVATALGGTSCALAHKGMIEQPDDVQASLAEPDVQQAAGNVVEMALDMAMHAHRGRVDEAHQPCILHPLRVMHAVEGDEARAVALLHGVLDDTGITVDDLRREGFPAGVIAAVEALTPLDGEDDAAFLDRVRLVPLARQVKLADLEDKLDIRRLSDFAAQDAELIANYVRAWQRLRQA